MIKRFLIILVFILGYSSLNAYAQEKSVDTAKTNNIIYLLKISGTADFAYLIVEDVVKNYQQFVTNTPADYWNRIIAETDILPFMKSVIKVYDQRFTNEEISELIKFFESPVGNKWSLELKDMNEEVMIEANQFGQSLFTEINARLIKDGYINNQTPDKAEPTNQEEQIQHK